MCVFVLGAVNGLVPLLRGGWHAPVFVAGSPGPAADLVGWTERNESSEPTKHAGALNGIEISRDGAEQLRSGNDVRHGAARIGVLATSRQEHVIIGQVTLELCCGNDYSILNPRLPT